MLGPQPQTAMAPQTCLSLVLFLITSQVSCDGCQSPSNEMTITCKTNQSICLYAEVQKALWNSTIRPVTHTNDVLSVKLGVTFSGILGVDEKQQVLTVFLVITLDWCVPFLIWDNATCGTNAISYPKSELWLPDIQIQEFMDEDKDHDLPYLQLNYTGGVHLIQLKRISVSCQIDIYKFPFDVQICSLTFHSYMLEENELTLFSKSTKFTENSSISSDSGWQLVSVKIHNSSYNLTSKRSFSAIRYNVTLKRQSSIYVVNLLVPSCFLSLLDLFSFFMPLENIDRSAFKMTLILGYTVFLLITNDLLPDNAATTPLINVFFSLSMALMVASLLVTLLVVKLSTNVNSYPRVPRWLRILALDYLARILFMSPQRPAAAGVILNPNSKVTPKTSGEAMTPSDTGEKEKMEGAAVVDELKKVAQDVQTIRQTMEDHLRPTQDNNDWKMIANVIDRLVFLLYILFVFVSYTTISVIWARS